MAAIALETLPVVVSLNHFSPSTSKGSSNYIVSLLIPSLSYDFKFFKKSKLGPKINFPLSSKLFFQNGIVMSFDICSYGTSWIGVNFKLKYMAMASRVIFRISWGFLFDFISLTLAASNESTAAWALSWAGSAAASSLSAYAFWVAISLASF